MKRFLVFALLFSATRMEAQSVFGSWYGNANVKTKNSTNNYLVELILLPEKNQVKGIFNYYFKDTYRSFAIKGDYQTDSRLLNLYSIPLAYHASLLNMEVVCMMNMIATLYVAQAGSTLKGNFEGLPSYKYTCQDVSFTLTRDPSVSKKDSVLKAFNEFESVYRTWNPLVLDPPPAITVTERKSIQPVIEKKYAERVTELIKEIEVDSDSLKVDFYDNGQVDGDSISVFFNKQLEAFHQRLSTKPIHFDLVLDSMHSENELSMFADNLGTISPNTALMIIYDGTKRYAITMQSNMEKNATIRIKRKSAGKKSSE